MPFVRCPDVFALFGRGGPYRQSSGPYLLLPLSLLFLLSLHGQDGLLVPPLPDIFTISLPTMFQHRFNQLCQESPHAAGLVSRNPRNMFCTVCKQKPAAWDRDQLRDWLQSPCAPVPVSGSLPSAAPLRIGSQVVHPSHSMRFYEHVKGWACVNCGNISMGGVIRKLAKPCTPVLLKAGKENLDELAKGKYPGRSTRAKAFNAALKRR